MTPLQEEEEEEMEEEGERATLSLQATGLPAGPMHLGSVEKLCSLYLFAPFTSSTFKDIRFMASKARQGKARQGTASVHEGSRGDE